MDNVFEFQLFKTTRRLTFEILRQPAHVTWMGEDDDPMHPVFTASNGVQVISRSRMDIHTDRIWLLGAVDSKVRQRSGTLVFSSDTKRDREYARFIIALTEWARHNNVFLLQHQQVTKKLYI